MKQTEPITTLVFDWGNTLMEMRPGHAGPMATWPQVHTVPGAAEALQALSGRYRLVVASNAGDSDAAQVLAALERADLRGYIAQAFTPSELHALKPQREFFRALEKELDSHPEQLCMVGDDFWADVQGAWQAGWTAIWFNRKAALCPGLTPPYDAEFTDMIQLPEEVESLGLPGLAQCQAWLAEQGASFNILQHVHMVAAISYTLACWLRNAGQPVNPLLAHRGGMLHDLARISARHIAPQADHGEVAASLLRSSGQEELAQIALRHVLDRLADPEFAPRTWEEKIVHFADKLVEAGQVVDLQTRLDALAARYAGRAGMIQSSLPLLAALQDELCAAAGFPSSDLLRRLKSITYNG